MNAFRTLLASLVLLVALLPASRLAQAAESYDNCTGFIDTVPATISTQGVWCLRHDLATNISSNAAINITASNITIDCNGFKLGDLAAGPGTLATAIYAYGTLSNISVRHCIIRGFGAGIMIYANDPGNGHLVEDNLLDHNTRYGIYVMGGSVIVRRNRVLDTGGHGGDSHVEAISATGDVIDNVIDGVAGAASDTDFSAYGIYAGSVGGFLVDGVVVRGNRVRNLVPKGTGEAVGIATASTGSWIHDNSLVEPVSSTPGRGVYCSSGGIFANNLIFNYTTGNSSCTAYAGDAGGNVIF